MKNIQSFIDNYILELTSLINKISKVDLNRIIGILLEAYKDNKKIFIFGNGGSAATSSHFANDLNKLCSIEGKKRFKALALTDNVPLMTAWANDNNYNSIFVQQLRNLMEENDICIAISCSGNSENVINAMAFAKEMKGLTIGLLGFEGGKLKNIADNCIIIKSDVYGMIEDAHHIICHIIANCLMEIIKGSENS